jgi:hypothetical protein
MLAVVTVITLWVLSPLKALGRGAHNEDKGEGADSVGKDPDQEGQ